MDRLHHEYSLEEGLIELQKRIGTLMSEQKRTIVVAVAGGSASGKTSAVSRKLQEMFGEDASIFSMDDYYWGLKFMETQAAQGRVLNWDQPDSINIQGFRAHLLALKRGEAIKKPIFNFLTNEGDRREEFRPTRLIIAEGLFVLGDELGDEIDLRAFVETSTKGRLTRRILRDAVRAAQSRDHIERYFVDVVEPMHQQYVESTKRNADLVILNEYDPACEGVLE